MIFDEHFWILISFILFVLVAYKPVRLALNNAINSKINKIKYNLKESEEIYKNAKNILQTLEEQLANMSESNSLLMQEAATNIATTINKKKKDIDTDLEARYKATVEKLEQQKKAVINDIQQEFLSTVHKLITEIIKDKQDKLDSDIAIATKFLK